MNCCPPFSASDSSSGTSPITISPKQCAFNTPSNYNNTRARRKHQVLTASGNSNREELKTFLGGHVLLIRNTFYKYWLNSFNRLPGCFDFRCCKAACTLTGVQLLPALCLQAVYLDNLTTQTLQPEACCWYLYSFPKPPWHCLVNLTCMWEVKCKARSTPQQRRKNKELWM